jgi:HK97 gp10 family phage protein
VANLSTSGLDDLLKDLESIAELPDDVILGMLSAEADVVADAQKSTARALGVFGTGKTAESVTYDKKLKSNGTEKVIYVYPKGTRSDGNRRSVGEVAFINEFGKRGQPARPFISTANEKSAEAATEAAAKVYDDYLKSKNL